MAKSTSLTQAIARLETALVAAGHPLGDPQARPRQRDTEELRAISHELLNFELSAELLELWGWWSGHRTFEALGHLNPLAWLLPGGLAIHDVEMAHQFYDMRLGTALVTPSTTHWLPIGRHHDAELVWCDLSDPIKSQSPIIINDLINPADVGEICRFDSIAELIETSADLIERGLWIDDPTNSWHYVGERGEAWF